MLRRAHSRACGAFCANLPSSILLNANHPFCPTTITLLVNHFSLSGQAFARDSSSQPVFSSITLALMNTAHAKVVADSRGFARANIPKGEKIKISAHRAQKNLRCVKNVGARLLASTRRSGVVV